MRLQFAAEALSKRFESAQRDLNFCREEARQAKTQLEEAESRLGEALVRYEAIQDEIKLVQEINEKP